MTQPERVESDGAPKRALAERTVDRPAQVREQEAEDDRIIALLRQAIEDHARDASPGDVPLPLLEAWRLCRDLHEARAALRERELQLARLREEGDALALRLGQIPARP